MKIRSYDELRRLTAYLQTIADWKEGFERRAQRAQLQAETAGLDAEEQDRLLDEGRAHEQGPRRIRKAGGMNNAQLDAEVVAFDAKRNSPRIKLMPFNSISLSSDRRYLVKGVIPYPGLTVIWGPPKSGKSFWTLDLAMHVALGREYRAGG